MPTQPKLAEPPEVLYRVARRAGLLSFSEIAPEDAALPKAGNRFDVPGGGVLYVGSDRQSCYAETLARFRPTPKIRAVLRDAESEGFMVTGGVPQDWRLQRVMGTLQVHEDALPFLDVEAAETQAYLSEALAPVLVSYGYEENLDLATVCGQDRRVTRAIAAYCYTAMDDDGGYLYSGIRYKSRIDARWECWALFDGVEVEEKARGTIELDDLDLMTVANMWDLRIF